MLRTLEPYGARKLGIHRRGDAVCSEVLEFLAYLLHLEARPVRLLPSALDGYLPHKRITFARDALEIRGVATGDVRLAAILSIKEYAPGTSAGILDPLLRARTSSCSPRASPISSVSGRCRHWRSSDA